MIKMSSNYKYRNNDLLRFMFNTLEEYKGVNTGE